MPDANTLTVGIFATLAQHERELISGRTKAALDAKRAQGIRLGSPQNLTPPPPKAQAKGVAGNARKAELNENNRRALSMIKMMLRAGRNYTEIARELNQAGFRTARSCEFQATQVMRLAQRAKNLQV